MHTTIDIQGPYQDIAHRLYPADDRTGVFGTLKLAAVSLDVAVFLDTPAEIDAVIAELAALRAEMAGGTAPGTLAADDTCRLTLKGEAVAGTEWCPAFTELDYDDGTVYCDREAGHPGSHRAPGPDEGSEVAWSGTQDETPAAVTL